MTDNQIQVLAEKYKQLGKLVEREQSKSDPSIALISSLENQMARIETQFQQADVDIMQWI